MIINYISRIRPYIQEILLEIKENPVYWILLIPILNIDKFIYSDTLLKSSFIIFIGTFTVLQYTWKAIKNVPNTVRITYGDMLIIVWSLIFTYKSVHSQQLAYIFAILSLIWVNSKTPTQNDIPKTVILIIYCQISVGLFFMFENQQISLKGFLHNSGVYANCILPLFPIILYINNTAKKIKNQFTKYLPSIALFSLAIYTNSRIAIISGLIAATFYIYKELPTKKIESIKQRVLKNFPNKLLLLIFFCVVLLFTLNYKSSSSFGRLLIYSITLKMICDSPIQGEGIGAFKKNYLDYQSKYFTSTPDSKLSSYADNNIVAFNEYLQIWYEVGFVAVILIALSLLYLFTIKSDTTSNRQTRSLKLSCLITCLLALFSYPLQDVNSSIYSIFLIGFLCSKDERIILTFKSNGIYRRVVIVAFFAGITYLVSNTYSFIVTYKAYRLWDKLVISQSSYETNLIDMYKEIYQILKKDEFFLYNYAVVLSEKGLYKDSNKILDETLDHFNDVNIWTTKGDNYLALGDRTRAEQYYIYAYTMIPNRFHPLDRLSNLYKKSNEKEKLIEISKIIVKKEIKVRSSYINEIIDEAKYNLLNQGEENP